MKSQANFLSTATLPSPASGTRGSSPTTSPSFLLPSSAVPSSLSSTSSTFIGEKQERGAETGRRDCNFSDPSDPLPAPPLIYLSLRVFMVLSKARSTDLIQRINSLPRTQNQRRVVAPAASPLIVCHPPRNVLSHRNHESIALSRLPTTFNWTRILFSLPQGETLVRSDVQPDAGPDAAVCIIALSHVEKGPGTPNTHDQLANGVNRTDTAAKELLPADPHELEALESGNHMKTDLLYPFLRTLKSFRLGR